MKKSLFIILMVCLAVVGLVSCKNEVEPAQEELIYVSFENGTSRALTATLETFDVSKYYWAYEAKKNDGSGLKSGETGWDTDGTVSVPVSAGNKGLGTGTGTAYEAYKVPNFSKGYWNFRLFAYTACSGSGTDTDPYIYSGLVYWGEVDSVLIDNSHHEAKVTVSPVSGDKGYLKIGTIALIPAEGGDPTDLVIYTDKVYVLGETTPVAVEPVDGVYTLDAGQYQFTRTYSFAGIPVAEGSVIVTIYSGLTTTVSGTLSELTTYTEFGAEQNPDIIIKSVSASGITSTTEGDADGNVNLVDSSIAPENQKVTAAIPAAAAVALLPKDPTTQQADPNATMSLALNVDTTASTSTSVTYDISMTKTVTIDSESTTSNVPEVSDWVIVEIVLRSGLNDVAVTHSTVPMAKKTSMQELKDSTTEAFFYDSDAGKLYIKTKSFSPFEVTYKLTDAVAAVISKDKYTEYSSLAEAIGAVQDGEGIILLADTETGSAYTITNPLVLNKKDVVFDLNGKKLTVTGNFSLLISGNNDVVKNGTIQAGANSAKATKINSYAIVINGCDGAVLEDLVINGGVSFGGSTGETPSPAAATNAVIRDCVVTSGDYYAVCAQQNSTVTIESGNYTADSRSATSGTIQGTFKGGDGPKGTVTVTGGVFNGPIVNNDKGDLVLKGGLYSVKPADKYLANGYITIKTSDNKWEVVEFLPGTGTEADPYVIADIDAWMLLVKCCEYDSTYSVTDGKYFEMTSNIDVSSKTVRATVHYFAGHIDFTNHVLSGFNSSNMVGSDIPDSDLLVAVFSLLKGNVSFKNLTFNISTVSYGNDATLTTLTGRLYGDNSSILFENITTEGIATGVMGNNNGPLFTYAVYVNGVSITCRNCTNNATIIGSGYKSAFIGNVSYLRGNATLRFENCVNNGLILSSDESAAMLINNGSNYSDTTRVVITVDSCVNYGRIIGKKTDDGALVMVRGDGYSSDFTINGKTWAEYKADTTIGGNMSGNPGETISASSIGVNDGCFVLNKVDGAAYYQLQFAFSASSHAGGKAGYLIEFGNSTTPFDSEKNLPSDIAVSSWVDDETKEGEVSSYVPTNATKGTLYKDASGHYVFNEQGSRLRDKVFVTFIAYGSNNEILKIEDYQYQ